MSLVVRLPLDTLTDAVATAVRTELAVELGRVDVAISTRATPSDVNADAHVEVS